MCCSRNGQLEKAKKKHIFKAKSFEKNFSNLKGVTVVLKNYIPLSALYSLSPMRSLAKNVYYYVVYTFTLNFSSNQKYILYKSSYQPTTRCVWNNSLCSKASRIRTESQMCTLLYYLLHHSNVNGYEFGIDWWAGCAQFQRFFEIIISIFFIRLFCFGCVTAVYYISSRILNTLWRGCLSVFTSSL